MTCSSVTPKSARDPSTQVGLRDESDAKALSRPEEDRTTTRVCEARPTWVRCVTWLIKWPGRVLRGPKWLHTHFYYFGINFSIAQDICYTGLSGWNCFVSFGAFIRYFLWTCQLHTLIVWDLIFRLHTHTSVTQKSCFRIICVIMLGLIVIVTSTIASRSFVLSKPEWCESLTHARSSW